MSRKPICVIIVLVLIAAGCCIYFFLEYNTAQKEIAEYSEIQAEHTMLMIEETANTEDGAHLETDGLPYTLVDWDALLAENPETVGWIATPDSLINYPVVQAKNNSKYLNTSFAGEKSRTGAVFADMNNHMEPLDQNTVLYAHNMGKGRTDMFGTLLYYKEQAHYNTHRYVQFDTVYEQHGWWKVFAVIQHNLNDKDFNYLNLQFSDQDVFMEWITQAQERH